MSDFYGKRRKSWHVACVIFRSGSESYSVETFVHVFDTCTQDWFSSSILEHLLITLKEEHKNCLWLILNLIMQAATTMPH